VRARGPSVARDGRQVLYQVADFDTNIWELPGLRSSLPDRPHAAPTRLIASTFGEVSPQFSPDGTRVAFVSHRSGMREIWVSKSDGSEQIQLTHVGRFCGSPRWSPDGRHLAFDSIQTGTWNVYAVSLEGGPVRSVTRESSHNVRPSWSRVERWIYFASDRTGEWQIWKVPSSGGAQVQMTRGGGKEAFESPDGEHLFFVKPVDARAVWQVPVNGGPEVRILDRGIEMAWAVSDRGIVLMDRFATPGPTIEFFDLATRRLVPVAVLPSGSRLDVASPNLAVSRDGRRLLFVQSDEWASDIEVVNLR
jgi:Tol biopolymer transport system component